MIVIVVAGGDDADGKIADAGECVFVSDFRLAHDLGFLRIDTTVGQRLAERTRLRAPGIMMKMPCGSRSLARCT